MRTSLAESVALALAVRFSADETVVDLSDGRIISVPLAWFPRLLHASAAQKKKWEIIGDGVGVHWPLIDEDLSLSLIHISEPTRLGMISYAVFCLKKKK